MSEPSPEPAPVLLFDVNETLLDLRALDPFFGRVFGAAAVRERWFQQVIESALVTIATGRYRDFGAVGAGALEMTARRHGVTLSEADRRALAEGMRSLPPHPEVPGALRRLREAGFRLATLTNNPQAVVEAQLANAGLAELFERICSADDAGRLKPAPEPYRMAAERLAVPVGHTWLVAAHAWDVAGALAAGCHAAFVARPGKVADPLADQPEVAGPDLDAVATLLLDRLGRPGG